MGGLFVLRAHSFYGAYPSTLTPSSVSAFAFSFPGGNQFLFLCSSSRERTFKTAQSETQPEFRRVPGRSLGLLFFPVVRALYKFSFLGFNFLLCGQLGSGAGLVLGEVLPARRAVASPGVARAPPRALRAPGHKDSPELQPNTTTPTKKTPNKNRIKNSKQKKPKPNHLTKHHHNQPTKKRSEIRL